MTDKEPRISFLSQAEARTVRQAFVAWRGWGEWLAEVPWDHVVTLTFKYPNGSDAALKCFRTWMRRVEQRADGRIQWYCALEYGGGGRVHLHVVMKGTAVIGAYGLKAAWSKFGHCAVEKYQPHRGATYYVSKQVRNGLDRCDFNLRGLRRASSQSV